ncbi:uncharacterized protein C11orf97 homolog [Numenius arquata]|uniref:uncharacterized protein C11orf97 homolog n=1 Tax=Numenius arquata TaxID=31919 RepID=UPI003D3067DD
MAEPTCPPGTRLLPSATRAPPSRGPKVAEGGQGGATLLCPAGPRLYPPLRRAPCCRQQGPAGPPPPPALAPVATDRPARPDPTCPGAAAAMRAASGEPRAVAAEEAGSDVRGQGAAGGEPWKKAVYVEPSRRVKEILEEELSFRKEACHVKHPAAVALEGIWSVRKNFSLGSLKPVSQNRNGLLLQPQFYSRHAGTKSKSQ